MKEKQILFSIPCMMRDLLLVSTLHRYIRCLCWYLCHEVNFRFRISPFTNWYTQINHWKLVALFICLSLSLFVSWSSWSSSSQSFKLNVSPNHRICKLWSRTMLRPEQSTKTKTGYKTKAKTKSDSAKK